MGKKTFSKKKYPPPFFFGDEIILTNGNRKIKIKAIFPESENAILRFTEITPEGGEIGRVDINPNRQSVEGLALIAGFDNNTDMISFEEGFIRGDIKDFLDNNYL